MKISNDCLEVANSLQSDVMDRGRYGAIVKECIEWSNQFSEASFSHEGRGSNGEAHSLARYASSLEIGRLVWFCLPTMFLCIPINIIS